MQVIHRLFVDDVATIDSYLNKFLDQVSYDREISSYIRHAVKEGKRLRPLICLLTYDILSSNKKREDQHYRAACALELIHNASLLIDDIFDQDIFRRKSKSFYLHFSTFAALAVSYTMSSLAIRWASKSSSFEIVDELIDSTHNLAKSLFEENKLRRSKEFLSKTEIISHIDNKTATLFQSAARIGALLASSSNKDLENFKKIGLYYGRAYQLHDDILSLISSVNDVGKSGVVSDIENRVQTYILLEALKNADDKQRKILEEYYLHNIPYSIDNIKETLISCGVIKNIAQKIKSYVDEIKDILCYYPDSFSRRKLEMLAENLLIAE